MQRVVNARPLVLKDAGGTWYALAAGHWYLSRELAGEWAVLASPPAALAAAQNAAAQQRRSIRCRRRRTRRRAPPHPR